MAFVGDLFTHEFFFFPAIKIVRFKLVCVVNVYNIHYLDKLNSVYFLVKLKTRLTLQY